MSQRIAIVPWGDVIEDYLQPIGLSVQDFARSMTGGWLFGYVNALRSAGLDPLILAPSSTVRTVRQLEHAATGAPIWLVPGRSCQHIVSSDLRALRQWLTTPLGAYRKVLRDERCDTLLVQDYERPQFDALLALGRTTGLPVFATFQGGDRTLSRIERRVRGRSLRRAAGLIVAASAERKRLAATYKLLPSMMADVPNPLDLGEWKAMPRSAARVELGIDDERFVAITHGRIDIHRKGLDLLLAAWSGPGELVLIGSGQDRDRFRAMLGGRSDVRWLDGYSNDRQLLRRWLSAADVYISASRIEGMPVAPLEAMACSLPVIVSAAQGLEDIFASSPQPPGLLFTNGDVGALAAAISRIRDDPGLRQQCAINARLAVEQRYSIAFVGAALRTFLGRRVSSD